MLRFSQLYPGLDYTREWEGLFITGTVGDFGSVGDSSSDNSVISLTISWIYVLILTEAST